MQSSLENIDSVVLVTSNYWNGMEYQRHHLARRFAATGTPVIFVERSPQRWPRFSMKDLLEWYHRNGQGEGQEKKPLPVGIRVKNPRLLPPSTWLRPINRRIIKTAFECERADGCDCAPLWGVADSQYGREAGSKDQSSILED